MTALAARPVKNRSCPRISRMTRMGRRQMPFNSCHSRDSWATRTLPPWSRRPRLPVAAPSRCLSQTPDPRPFSRPQIPDPRPSPGNLSNYIKLNQTIEIMNAAPKGKIGRLPKAIQEQVNRRLEHGEQARPLIAWLNALPALLGVPAVLAAECADKPIREQNSAFQLQISGKNFIAHCFYSRIFYIPFY